MEENLKEFIKRAKAIKLSNEERSLLRSKISEFIAFTPIRGELPVIREKNYLSVFAVKHFIKATSLVLIFAVIVGGTGVSYAASSALPGDALYSIKININEGIEASLATTPEAKAVVQSNKVKRRLNEAQTLAKENKLSVDNQKIVIAKIEQHIDDLSKQIDILKENGDVTAILETTAKLTPVLEAHRDILKNRNDENESENGDEGDSNTNILVAQVDSSLKKVQEEEDSIIATVEDGAESSEIDTNSTEPDTEVATTLMKTDEDSPDSESVEAQATLLAEKTAAKQIKEITNKVSSIVEDRINSARRKIAQVKKVQEEYKETQKKQEQLLKEKEQSTVVIKEDTEPTPEVVKAETDVSTKETISMLEITESKIETNLATSNKNSSTTSSTPPTVKKTAPIKSVISPAPINMSVVDNKINAAEDMIKEAEKLLRNNKFKEALIIAQDVNKIANEIETLRKLKALELSQKISSDKPSQNNLTTEVNKAE